MIVRRIRALEYKRIQELMSLAFEFPYDNEKSAEDVARECRERPGSELDAQPECTWAAFEDDDETIMASVCSIPFISRFDGHDVPMFGIGGVNTLPMYRRRGCIRAIFDKALPAMYADGGVFSYLYPFSNSFYRAFGYERGCERSRWTVKLEAIPKWSVGGYTRLAQRGADLAGDARRVYGAWSRKYSMMTKEQNDCNFKWVSDANPFKSCEYTYLYYAADGEPKGYVTFKPQNDRDGHPLECSRFVFADKEGFKGLLTLLKGFAADHERASFYLPEDIDWLPLLPEASFGNVSREVCEYGMVRVVNLEKALMLARTRGEGELVLEIADKQIPENNGRFAVRWSGGRVNAVERVYSEPHMRMDIGDFSRLIIGRQDMREIEFMEGVELLCPPEKAEGLFYRKPCCIIRYF